jgi:hypothetical protein
MELAGRKYWRNVVVLAESHGSGTQQQLGDVTRLQLIKR